MIEPLLMKDFDKSVKEKLKGVSQAVEEGGRESLMLFRSYKALWRAVEDFEIRAANVEALYRRLELSLMKVGSERLEETDRRLTLEFERQELRAQMSRRGSSADASISRNSQMVDNPSYWFYSLNYGQSGQVRIISVNLFKIIFTYLAL